MNDELLNVWGEKTVSYFEVRSLNLLGVIEEKNGRPQGAQDWNQESSEYRSRDLSLHHLTWMMTN